MKKEIAEQWVKALRSGDYAQGRGQLRKQLAAGDALDSFCCLGVLCDLHRKATREGDWVNGLYENASGKRDNSFDVPTSNVVDWAGLSQANPEVDLLEDEEDELTEDVEDELTIAELNDGYGWSFEQLADLIEQHWEDM